MDNESQKDPPDLRPIAELRFGAEWKPSVSDLMADRPPPEELIAKTIADMTVGVLEKEKREPTQAEKDHVRDVTMRAWASRIDDAAVERWKETHATALETMQKILIACGCATADDIKKLGCTGVQAHLNALAAVVTEIEPPNVGAFLRLGLGGSGVGLPCFVPQTRYCLVHDTIGGLQEGQKAHYESVAEVISRTLTPIEQGRVQLTERARRMRGHDRSTDALDALSGFKLPEGFEMVGDDEPEEDEDGDDAVLSSKPRRSRSWTCRDHDTPNWACRYCMAQAIIEGPLLPLFVLDVPDGHTHASVTPDELTEELSKLDEAGAPSVEISVRVATLKRKLTRE